jgi:hypothetical protein
MTVYAARIPNKGLRAKTLRHVGRGGPRMTTGWKHLKPLLPIMLLGIEEDAISANCG